MNFFELDETKPGCVVKSCTRERQAQSRGRKHRFCRRCRDRRYAQSRPVSYAYDQLRSSARRRQISFTLTIEEFERWCLETGYIEKKGRNPEGMTVDRIKSELGYSIDNIQIATNLDNATKGNRDIKGRAASWTPPQIEPADEDNAW